MKISKEEKAMWVEDWLRSGKGAWTYAKENGLVPQTFTRWTKPKTKNKSSFVEVPAGVFRSKQNAQELVIEKGDIKIRIPLSCGSSELQKILAALAGAI